MRILTSLFSRQQGVYNKQMRLLQSFELSKYILENSVYPREPSPLKEIRDATANHPAYFTSTAPNAAQLMGMLLKLLNAKKTIEIGVYTGYSLLLTALSTPHDAMSLAIDPDREAYEIGLPIIQKAGVEHKINFIQSQALPVLDQLLQNLSIIYTSFFQFCLAILQLQSIKLIFLFWRVFSFQQKENEASFDFAFVDADKDNYLNYHERLLKLVKVGGLIAFDNTLWGGTVVQPEEAVPRLRKEIWRSVIEFNKLISTDQQVEISLAQLGDGITICRRVC